MAHVVTRHTAELDPATARAARALLYEAFDDMTEDDWEHCLGGIHALAYSGPLLVGHASLVQRRLVHRGVALRAGYVEGVAVRATARRRGHGAALMGALERFIRGGYDLGALGATDEAVPFYESRGWRRWRGPLSALTLDGVRRTPDEDGGVYVLPGSFDLDMGDPLMVADWRDGDVW
ncbi:GNAT family N-acetyltransferase [Luedemannella helvata]|uniref:GNAT family N-acetyltransferase n=1 Tax=Luedemannella helvata TaxID=349315 RepID=A0ABP4X5R8_9ACTN